jgi:putative Holliday junction resolvase
MADADDETVGSSAMRALGLDLGTKTIGVAVSDELGMTAQGITTIERRGPRKDLEALQVIVTEYGADRFVLGLPLNMDGSEGPRAETTRKFGDALEAAIKLPVIYQDERLTTVSATRVLLEADMSRQKRKAVIDQVAASFILQAWLDTQSHLASLAAGTPDFDDDP